LAGVLREAFHSTRPFRITAGCYLLFTAEPIYNPIAGIQILQGRFSPLVKKSSAPLCVRGSWSEIQFFGGANPIDQ